MVRVVARGSPGVKARAEKEVATAHEGKGGNQVTEDAQEISDHKDLLLLSANMNANLNADHKVQLAKKGT